MNKYVIETKQLTKTYGEQTVVNSVNIHVKQGQIYGLLGRNGAGKTTIMKMILGVDRYYFRRSRRIRSKYQREGKKSISPDWCYY